MKSIFRKVKANRWLLIQGVMIVIGCAILWKLASSSLLNLSTSQGTKICKTNLLSIGHAAIMYHQEFAIYPERVIFGKDGQPEHSWRAVLSRYLPTTDYADYSFLEPWDGPNNRRLHLSQTKSKAYHCPKDPGPVFNTSYVAVFGDRTVFPEKEAVRHNEIGGTSFSETEEHISIIKGKSNTIFSVEFHNSGINILEPQDLSIDDAMKGINAPPPSISSLHKRWIDESYQNGGAASVFVDGSARFLNSNIDPKLLRSLLEIDNPDKPKEKFISP